MDPSKRVPVQSDDNANGMGLVQPRGTIEFWEFSEAWTEYARRYGNHQTPGRFIERGGFSYSELVDMLGRYPRTWRQDG